MNTEETTNIQNMLRVLGWAELYGGLWIHKNRVGAITFENALSVELQGLLEFRKGYFVCPDCEYGVTPIEFLTGGKQDPDDDVDWESK